MMLANGMPLGCGLMYEDARITTLSSYDDFVALCETYMNPDSDEYDLTAEFVDETSSSLSRIRMFKVQPGERPELRCLRSRIASQ